MSEKEIKNLRIFDFSYGVDTSYPTVEKMSELIRERAYQLFEERGRQSGHELDDWLQAEQEIRKRYGI